MRHLTLTMLVLAVAATAAHSGATQGTIREIQFADAGHVGTISPDGRYAAFTPPAPGVGVNRRQDLAIRDLRTNEVRTIVTRTDTAHIGGPAPMAWSFDSTRLAFVWCYRADKVAGTLASCEVRTLALEGATPQTLVPRLQGSIELYSWSPDSRSILGLIRQDRVPRVVLISTADGSLRDLPVTDPGGDVEPDFRSPAFSPDGRFIAYSRDPVQQTPYLAYLPADAFILSIDDGDDRPLIVGPDSERFVAWTRDGGVLFTTDRSGTVDLMRAKTTAGRIVDPPTLVRRDVGPILGRALTSDGRLFYATEYDEQLEVQLVDFDPATGRIASSVRTLPTDGRRVSRPVWIEGGKSLVYESAPAKPAPMFMMDGYDSIAIRDAQSGKTRTVQLQHHCRDSWNYWTIAQAPVPNRLLMSVTGAPAPCRGVYMVDTTTGLTTALIESAEYVRDAQYLPGGRDLLYIRAQRLVVRSIESGPEKVIVDLRSITGELEGATFSSAAVSHDGKRVAAMVVSRSQQTHLVEVSLTDGKLRQIPGATLPKTPGSNPVAWTADDIHLLYVADPKPGQPGAVWRIVASGGTPEKIGLTINTGEQISVLAVHPGGRQIAFELERRRNPRLFVLEDFLTSASVSGGERR